MLFNIPIIISILSLGSGALAAPAPSELSQRGDGSAEIVLGLPAGSRMVDGDDTSVGVMGVTGKDFILKWPKETLDKIGNNEHTEKAVWWDVFESPEKSVLKWHIKCRARISSNFANSYRFDLLTTAPWKDSKGDVSPDAAAFGCFLDESECISDCENFPSIKYSSGLWLCPSFMIIYALPMQRTLH
ncbi:hypothetical protein I204_00253 [Kwoniella mangroviensis CBS 8886]|nr:hypothetical protein I204_00253 [Kwoniella mangroviensis CBS 8886]